MFVCVPFALLLGWEEQFGNLIFFLREVTVKKHHNFALGASILLEITLKVCKR